MIPEKDIFLAPVKLRKSYILNHYPKLWENICDLEPKTISEKLYWFYEKLTQYPTCKYCGKPVKFITLFKGYQLFCSQSCCAKDPERIKKSEHTCLKKYGYIHPSQAKTVKEKIKNTNISKYGGIGFASKELNEKSKQTCLERYGTDNPMKLDSFKDKAKQTLMSNYGSMDEYQEYRINKSKQTCLERYGTDNPMKLDSFKDKAKQTLMSNYGSMDEYQEYRINKSKQTCLERYGTDNPMKSKEIQGKSKQTCLERYGEEYAILNKDVRRKNELSRMSFYIKKHDLIGIDKDGNWICKCPHNDCDKCSNRSYKITSSQYYARLSMNIEPCTNLLKISPSSNTYIEKFIKQILDDYDISYETNVRNIIPPKELDIYIPSKNIAIECNGCFWHSNIKHNDDYHIKKYIDCKDKNVQLLTFWEDQIISKPDIVKSLLLSKLGIYENKIYARKCIVKEINSKLCSDFLNKNHIQGKTNSSIKLGIFHKNELYGVMTFSLPSRLSGNTQINNSWVLSRFCTKKNTQIIGAADKLLKYFIKKYNPIKIISFSSNDISNGALYEKLGFIKDPNITKSYWYINKKDFKRYHRTSFAKNKLKEMGYDVDNKTEFEIMAKLPYLKIYDCGHVKYTLNVNNS